MTRDEITLLAQVRHLLIANGASKDIERMLDNALDSALTSYPVRPKRLRNYNGVLQECCPNCSHNEPLYYGQNFCSICGQAIDWGCECASN